MSYRLPATNRHAALDQVTTFWAHATESTPTRAGIQLALWCSSLVALVHLPRPRRAPGSTARDTCVATHTAGRYGVTWPEGFVGSSTRLANAEICATNRLVDRGPFVDHNAMRPGPCDQDLATRTYSVAAVASWTYSVAAVPLARLQTTVFAIGMHKRLISWIRHTSCTHKGLCCHTGRLVFTSPCAY